MISGRFKKIIPLKSPITHINRPIIKILRGEFISAISRNTLHFFYAVIPTVPMRTIREIFLVTTAEKWW